MGDSQTQKVQRFLDSGWELDPDPARGVIVRTPDKDGAGNPAWRRVEVYKSGKAEAAPFTPRTTGEDTMVVNVRLELSDEELVAIKSHIEGAPRKSKA